MDDPTHMVLSQYDYEHDDGKVLEGEVVDNEASAPIGIVPPPTDPMAVARRFLAEHHADHDGELLLRHHRGDFYAFDGRCWPEEDERKVRSALYTWLEDAVYPKGKKLEPFEPTRRKIADVVDALEAAVHIPQGVTAPAWLEGDDPATDYVVMNNGILHLPTRKLQSHTPRFFSHHALPFDYGPAAPVPERWERFLAELFGEDTESMDTLAEVFGYVLSGATRQQKMFLIVGPKRSGKGTTARVLSGLLGVHNTAAPTLASLTTNFGLSPLIGASLAVMSDARLSTRADSLVAVERLLSISGEDSITIDRKYRWPWTGRLPTRFLILTNELPRLVDSSGALASRFILFTLTNTFYGREDPRLTDTLLEDASGIFNWALEGLDRLNKRGHFVQPATAEEALRHLEDLSSPIGAFLRDRCEVGPAFEVGKDELWATWREWCQDEGKAGAGTKAVFMRDLRAAVPGIRVSRPRVGDQRVHTVQGLRLAPQSTGPLTTPDQEERSGLWSGIEPGQTRRSEAVVRDGQGSADIVAPTGPTPDQTPDQHTRPPGFRPPPEGDGSPAELLREVPAPTGPAYGLGDVVRRDRDPRRGARYKVKEVRDGQADVFELDFGMAGKLRTFVTSELLLVERKES